MGYGVTLRREQASDYLAQVRTRGVLTLTRQDYWHMVTGQLRGLFLGTPPPRRATVGSVRVVGPHPPPGDPLYLSARQVALYSPRSYAQGSWPWRGYTRILREDAAVPTISSALMALRRSCSLDPTRDGMGSLRIHPMAPGS